MNAADLQLVSEHLFAAVRHFLYLLYRCTLRLHLHDLHAPLFQGRGAPPSRGGVRFPRRPHAAGAPVDATHRVGMVLPAVLRTTPAVEEVLEE